MHYLLFYDVSADHLTRRAGFRAEHLGLAWAALAHPAVDDGGRDGRDFAGPARPARDVRLSAAHISCAVTPRASP